MSEAKFACTNCSKVYKIKKNLEKHMSVCENPIATFQCESCSKVYKTEKNLEKHKLTCKAPSDPAATFQCESCSKVYKTEKNLEKHKLTCGKVEGFSCPGCSKVMKSKGALTRHLSSCTIDASLTFECTQCKKKYVSEVALTQHKNFCQPLFEKGFNCVCGRICKSVRGLNHHQMKCPHAEVNKNKYEMAKSKALTIKTTEWYSEQQHGLYLYMTHNIYVTNKWAMFDLDGTLIKTKSGKKFGVSTSDWTWVSEDHPKKLRRLVGRGYTIVIISNQAGYKKDQTNLKEKFNQVQAALEDVPLVAAFATDYNLYRKPNDRIIGYLECFLSTKINLEKSFYVGDAAGRPKDHSCCDRKFAANVGVTFHTIEKFIDSEHQDEDFTWGFDPSEYLVAPSDLSEVLQDQPQELVLMCGYPGSGKSTFVKTHLFNHTYVSKDILKGKSLSPIVKKALSEGQSVVVDNTNLDPETRAFYINIAKDHNVPCRCYFLNLPLELCKHLNCVRNIQTNNDVKIVPSVAYNLLKSKFAEPSTDEGIAEVIQVPFTPSFNSEEDEKAFRKWTM